MAGKLDIEKPEIIWSDRRRRMGLPLSFTRYELTTERLTLRKGFFNTTTDDIMVYRIMDLRLNRSLWAKLCGVGTITLVSTDESHPTLVLKNIKQPEAVHRLLGERVESERKERGVSSREFLGDYDDNI